MSHEPVVAIVGVTGAVGAEFIATMDRRDFRVGKLKALASARSAGNTIDFRGQRIVIEELTENSFAGVDIALYCCGAYRAMNKAALNFYETVRREGTQKNIIDTLQTRAELYDFLEYHSYEQKLDALFTKQK